MVEELVLKEVFVGLYQTDSTTGERLASLILCALQRLHLPPLVYGDSATMAVATWLGSSSVSQPLVVLSSDMFDVFIKT